jgi:hypothetical protein
MAADLLMRRKFQPRVEPIVRDLETGRPISTQPATLPTDQRKSLYRTVP